MEKSPVIPSGETNEEQRTIFELVNRGEYIWCTNLDKTYENNAENRLSKIKEQYGEENVICDVAYSQATGEFGHVLGMEKSAGVYIRSEAFKPIRKYKI